MSSKTNGEGRPGRMKNYGRGRQDYAEFDLCKKLNMCGRFTATFEFSDIRVRWNLDSDLPKYIPRFNIAPETSPNIPVIVHRQGGNECRLMY